VRAVAGGFVLYGYGAVAGDLAELWYEITHRRLSSFLIIDCVAPFDVIRNEKEPAMRALRFGLDRD
jgi:hypothetical protein